MTRTEESEMIDLRENSCMGRLTKTSHMESQVVLSNLLVTSTNGLLHVRHYDDRFAESSSGWASYQALC